jgi:uncharacterized protein with FMN-binding domain
MEQSNSTRKKKIQAGIAFAALSVIVVGAVILSPTRSSMAMNQPSNGSKSDTSQSTTPITTKSSATATSSVSKTSMYKDGSYSATGKYYSPGGQESLKVSLTLSNDIVTASDVESGANDPTALTYQTSFIYGYKSHVIGKQVSSIKLSNISGSSLTSQGFQNALKQIEQQAKI